MPDAQLNAIKLAEAVRQRMVDFNASDLFVRDPDLAACLREAWSGPGNTGGLLSDLWVEGAFPPETSRDTLNSLEAEGVIEANFKKVLIDNNVFPPDQPLYEHQARSLREADRGYNQAAKPAITVTAGTGAGKTESFLFPLLNDLFRHRPTEGEGVCAIILYPMNALVNDQVDRLYNWLKGQEQVTLFHFTSETSETIASANRSGVPKWDPCRFRSRQQARGAEDAQGRKYEDKCGPVPRILVTNYSMLEYMLCRPQDAVFFGRNLRSLVLDEAHLYTGSLAAEVTLLQRRLLMRCGLTSSDVIQYATSATIGTKHLDQFIPKLFSKPLQYTVVIEGKARRTCLPPQVPPDGRLDPTRINRVLWPERGVMQMDRRGDNELRTAADDEWSAWQRSLATLVSTDRLSYHAAQEDRVPARLLRDALAESPVVHQLEAVLWQRRRLSLGELSELLWGERDEQSAEATRRILQLCASARSTARDYPLIPNRVHFLVRSVQGVTAFFDATKRERGIPWTGKSMTLLPEHRDRCPQTQTYGLSLARCRQCGEVYFQGAEHQGRLRAVAPHHGPAKGEVLRTFCFPEQAQSQRGPEVEFLPEQGRLTGYGAGGVRLLDLTQLASPAGDHKIAAASRASGCVNCAADINDHVHLFSSSYSLQRGILAETVLAAMPEKAGFDRDWLPARGRRLLVFSDSRSSAARLGPSLSRQHAIQVVRSAIVRNAPREDAETIAFLLEAIATNKAKLAGTASTLLRERLSEEISRAEIALSQSQSGGSLSDWASLLKKSLALTEVMDPETAQTHRAENWHQSHWMMHGKAMAENARLWISREIARRPSWPNVSLESLGLVEVVYPGVEKLIPPDSLLGVVPTAVRQRLEETWPEMVASLLDSLRTDGAVTLGGELDDVEYSDADYQVISKWASLNETFGSGLIGFIGKSDHHRRKAFVWRLLRAEPRSVDENPPDGLVEEILEALFEQLRTKSADRPGGFAWLKAESRESETGNMAAIQIDFSNVALRLPKRLFRCTLTGQVWPRAVCGDAPATVGLRLQAVEPDELDRDLRIGRMRQELQHSPVFEIGLWGEEHSAQL